MTLSIFLVEDDDDLREGMVVYLEGSGMHVQAAADAESFRRQFTDHPADVVVLDINLPDDSGFALASWVRTRSSAGLIILTGRTQSADRVHGLSLGADHYLNKPVNPPELELIIRNLGRRVAPPPVMPGQTEEAGPWQFDAAAWTLASPEGITVPLTGLEHHVLCHLLAAPGTAVSRQVLAAVIDREAADPEGRGLDTIVSRLRRKVERTCARPLPLRSVRNVGYVFTEQASVSGPCP